MREPDNIKELTEVDIDFMGMIFYEPSPRYIGRQIDDRIIGAIPSHIKKVGVFVNEDPIVMQQKYNDYGLDYIQLHGQESPQLCQWLSDQGMLVIKAFGMHDGFDFKEVDAYHNCVDYMLFDTQTQHHGGSGVKYNWDLLQRYKGETPFFLSGGININDVMALKMLDHPMLFALDVNSGFETAPGCKDIPQLVSFISQFCGDDKHSRIEKL